MRGAGAAPAAAPHRHYPAPPPQSTQNSTLERYAAETGVQLVAGQGWARWGEELGERRRRGAVTDGRYAVTVVREAASAREQKRVGATALVPADCFTHARRLYA